MSVVEKMNESSKGSRFLTPFLIVSIIVVTIIILLMVFHFKQNNMNAVKIFERAFLKIEVFDKDDFETRKNKEKDIVRLLDMVIKKYPQSPSGKRALYYKGHVLYHVEKYDEAQTVFSDFVKKFPSNYLTPKCYYFLSYCYSEKNDNQAALDALNIFASSLKDSYFAPMALYRIAFLNEKMNNKEEAITFYRKIVNDYADSSQKDLAEKKALLLENDIQLTKKDFFN